MIRPRTSVSLTAVQATARPSLRTAESKLVVCPPPKKQLEERLVKDRSYYKGKVDSKIGELKTEILEIRKKLACCRDDVKLFSLQKKQAQNAAKELIARQNYLSDLYAALDKVNLGLHASDIRNEADELRTANIRAERELEQILFHRISQQRNVEQLKSEIDRKKRFIIEKRGVNKGSAKFSNWEGSAKCGKGDSGNQEQSVSEMPLTTLKKQWSECYRLHGAKTNIDRTSLIQRETSEVHKLLSTLVERNLQIMTYFIENYPLTDIFDDALTPQKIQETGKEHLQSLIRRQTKLNKINKHVDSKICQLQHKIADFKMWFSERTTIDEYEKSIERYEREELDVKLKCKELKKDLALKRAELEYREKRLNGTEISELLDELRNSAQLNHVINEYLEEVKAEGTLEERKMRALEAVGRINETLCGLNP